MNPYEILGVGRDASAAAIKSGYRRAAKSAHPDRPGGSIDLMVQVNRAYALLTDQRLKERYDATGQTDDEPSPEQQAAGVLQQLFITVLCQTDDDPIVACRKEVRKGMHEGPQEITKQRRLITKLERALKKHLKGKADKPPILEAMLNMQILIQRNKLQQMEHLLGLGPLMLEMLQNYSWEGAEPPQPTAFKLQTVEDLISAALRDPRSYK